MYICIYIYLYNIENSSLHSIFTSSAPSTMKNMEATLKKYFGYSVFRSYQKEIIEQILDGRDSLVVMATGSGKSLCYQVPPLIVRKTAVVISPLLSLMQDQVMALRERGINADHISSAQTDSSVQRKAERGQYDILYMTPEKACSISTSFWENLLNLGMCLLAVDEAHCISEWGHDFRVEYKHLDSLRMILSNVPVVGLTATATEKVRVDIMSSLKMRNPYITIGSFDRNNLFYRVKRFDGSSFVDELVGEVSKFVNAGSTIIYCTTVKDVEQIYQLLLKEGVKAGSYHGQMGNKSREESHRSFVRDELDVMVATVAFGMGIDKPDIRHVIHYGCPKSLETYYQESGRCGRDGIASTCWLYYTNSDFARADFYCRDASTKNQRSAIMESFMAARRYCMLTTCRRSFLLDYFGERYPSENCGTCDNCTTSKNESDMSKEAFLLMASIRSCGGNFGLNMPVEVLRGSRSRKILSAQFDKLPVHGLGKELSANWWKALAHQLIFHGYLTETVEDVYRFVSVSKKGLQFLSSCNPDYQPTLVLPITSEMSVDEEERSQFNKAGESRSLAPAQCQGLSEGEAQLYKKLVEERMELARRAGTAPYAICGDQTLKKIALVRPSTKARLANIDGVNQHLVTMYGDQFIQTIQSLFQGLNLSLDGAITQPATAKPLYTVPKSDRKAAPAKVEAWRMWHEDGLSIQKIANFPGRAAPIKEETVINYVLEAAVDGCAMDWARFCQLVGLTSEIFTCIKDAISKVGREKLKPIKNELPEEITYTQIKTCLAMQDLGVSEEVFQSSHHPTYGADESHEDMFPMNFFERSKEEDSLNLANNSMTDPSLICVDDHSPNKRQKVDGKDVSTAMEATESSILDLLKNCNQGSSLSRILNHFNGSTEQTVLEILSCLESEFLIFKKDDLYKLM